MNQITQLPFHTIVPLVLLLILTLLTLYSTLVYIPNNKVGVVEKLWAPKGSMKSGLIAMSGEAGYQPGVLRGGWHFFVPLQYRIHKMPLVTVGQGKIGYVFARDGKDLEPNQALASNEVADDFEDAENFLREGGQKGPQRKILREGTYAINQAQFVVLTADRLFYLPLNRDDEKVFSAMATQIAQRQGFDPLIIRGGEDDIGIITVQEGPVLPANEIIAPIVGADPKDGDTYHECFQDPEKFLQAGGMRGRQLQVLTEGTYYINRLFATVEIVDKTIIEVGYVGVVVSYTGPAGQDVSGTEYKHGELVAKGCRGVWSEPLLPGKYAFNTYAGRVFPVPTTNFILKWAKGFTGSHKFDESLAEVDLITKDAFEPSLPVSAVVHIDYHKAPLVIQRFGDIKKLVEQTLDPLVSAYFKNIGQTKTLIELLQSRSDIQKIASQQMAEKFAAYSLELQEVLIGTPSSKESKDGKSGNQIETILGQLRSRQIADEQIETYGRQERAATKERELREVEAKAKQQTALTESAIAIEVQGNKGKADLAQAQQQAAQIQALATAEAEKLRIMGEGEAKRIQALAAAEADRTARVGIAQALAIEEQVRAYGGPKYQLTQQVMDRFAHAIETAKVDIVPRVMVGAEGSGEGGNNVVQALFAMLLSDKMDRDAAQVAPSSPHAAAMKESLRASVAAPAPQQPPAK